MGGQHACTPTSVLCPRHRPSHLCRCAASGGLPESAHLDSTKGLGRDHGHIWGLIHSGLLASSPRALGAESVRPLDSVNVTTSARLDFTCEGETCPGMGTLIAIIHLPSDITAVTVL